MIYSQVIKFAQYLSGLASHQDPYAETIKGMMTFFNADFAAFGSREDGSARVSGLSFSSRQFRESSYNRVKKTMKDAAEETLISSFFSTREIPDPEPISILCLPLQGERRTDETLLIGYRSADSFSQEQLDAFLAVAGLVGTILRRFISEKENLIGIFEAMPDIVYIVSSQHEIIYANPAFNDEFGDYLGSKCFELFNDRKRDCPWCHLGEVLSGNTVHWEWLCKKNNKTYDIIETPLKNTDGSISMLSIFRDISKLKQDQNKIQNLLEEKELILKEVHHRIKNNMTTMKSLLSLQQDSVTEDAAKDALRLAENRLTSIMVLYEKLYRGKSRHSISLDSYLPDLASEIIETFPLEVSLRFTLTPIELPVQYASPIGIIVNELITNAMKYAFRENRNNVLNLTTEEKRGEYGAEISLTVRDNGDGFDPNEINDGFGLHLVRSLAEQIKGEFRIEAENGAACILEFKL